MDMKDGEAPPAAQAVELVYRTTTADIAQAIRVRDANTAAGRRRRWLFPLTGALALLLAVQAIAEEGRFGPRAAGFTAGAVVLWTFVLFGHRLQARAFAGLLEKAGETRTVVDGSGLVVRTAAAESRTGWSAQPTYAETRDAFVMLSDDKAAVCMTVLPKRGVQDPADVDRLRAVLDVNLRRL
ncbi:YcxB family protein [Streptomyces sp. NPDC097981]|uniref:YcxB family protein n=1 Tax=Streptomyces sp. NPDC097981 TaxID=3155428 RepID=UPI003319F266